MLGFHTPPEMEGRVLMELFDRQPPVKPIVKTSEMPASAVVVDSRGPEDVYSKADLQAVTERLSDLGYLE
jgi:hypothetical protein